MTAQETLRRATREGHERLDAHFSAFDLGDRDNYTRFLIAHAAAFVPVEDALDASGAGQLVGDWQAHRRAALLMADLADLGIDAVPIVPPPCFSGEAELLGGAYVLEGSRLGGAVLKKQVNASLPRRFLDAPQAKGRWRGFVAQLEDSLYSPAHRARAAKAAVSTFACFERAAGVFGDA